MQAAGEAARQYMQAKSAEASPDGSQGHPPAEAGLVFALSQEMGCFEDRMDAPVRSRGNKLVVVRGEVGGHHVVAVQSGMGLAAAAHATEALILGHRPPVVISAGFCGGLHPDLKRNHIVMANEVVSASGESQTIPVQVSDQARKLATLHIGKLLTSDKIIRTAQEKQQLFQQVGALAVDMETAAVLAMCRRHDVPCLAVRAVSDTANETLPPEIFHLVQQKSSAGQLGAAVGALFRRPGSIKDLYQLKENALIAADTLAKFLEEVILELPPIHDDQPPPQLT